MKNNLIDSFIKNAKQNNVQIDSIVVEENGRKQSKVLRKVKLHELRSCSKVLIAFAYGIALAEQFVCKYPVGGGVY